MVEMKLCLSKMQHETTESNWKLEKHKYTKNIINNKYKGKNKRKQRRSTKEQGMTYKNSKDWDIDVYTFLVF